MKAAAGLSSPISQVIPAVMIFVMTKSLTWARIISLMSPSLSKSICHSPATPWVRSTEKISTPFSMAAMAVSPTCLTIRLRMFVQVSPNSEASSLMMPMQVELVGQLDPGLGERAEQPAHQALAQVVDDVVLELEDAALHPGDQVAEELDRRLDDVADHPGRAGEHAGEHRHELADGVDDGLDRADGLVDQALVLRLQGLDALVEALACLHVLRGEGVDHRLLLGVDVALQLGEPVADLLRRLGAHLLQVGGQALDVGGDLGAAGRDALLGGGQVVADDVGDAG